ncbi:MAG: VIT1/CCC1 transporter family protein [Candidatus Nanopelagicales bacterium]
MGERSFGLPGVFARIRRWGQRLGGDEVRRLVVDANDGIVGGAGIIEGLEIAGASEHWVVMAALTGMVAGSFGVASGIYLEESTEQEAVQAALSEEARRHALSPAEELAELAEIYEGRGLGPELALQVAEQLMAADPIGTHAREELGLGPDQWDRHPVRAAMRSGVSFAIGAALPIAAVVLAPNEIGPLVTLIAVLIALTITSTIAARSSDLNTRRTVIRTIAIGAGAMAATSAIGLLLG